MELKKIHFIINPASGLNAPILSLINRAFLKASVDWDVSVTKKPGDELECSRVAANSDASAIAIYGGDGTVAAVTKALYHTDKPLIILPGGTSNVFATSLGMPIDIMVTLTAIAENRLRQKQIDMALVNGQPLLMAITTGLFADNVINTPVDDKNRLGEWAYFLNTLRVLPQINRTRFELELDGKVVVTEAIALIVANSGQFSTAGFTLMAGQDNTDGKVDVLAVHNASPATLIDSIRIRDEIVSDTVSFWRASHAKLSVPPQVPILVDDLQVPTPATFDITVDPNALEFLVP